MFDNNKFLTGLLIFVGIISLIIIWLPDDNSAEPSSTVVQNQSNRLAKLKAQDYITVDQANNLFNKAKEKNNTKMMNRMDNLNVVDSTNGNSYLFDVQTKTVKHFLYDNIYYNYKLEPIKSAGKIQVNKAWQKEHKQR